MQTVTFCKSCTYFPACIDFTSGSVAIQPALCVNSYGKSRLVTTNLKYLSGYSHAFDVSDDGRILQEVILLTSHSFHRFRVTGASTADSLVMA